LSGIFVLGLLKIGGGGSRCVTYFRGVPGFVTKCDRGSQNWPKIAWRTLWTAPYQPSWRHLLNLRGQQGMNWLISKRF